MNNSNYRNGTPELVSFDYSSSLAKTVLNSLTANIAILDKNGVILETNQAWRKYATVNEMEGSNDSIGVNYLELCDATTGKEAKDAHNVAAGIRSVIKGEIKEFLYDYPCHGPDGRHFFYLRSIRVAEEALLKRERERDRLRHSLELAREVQQILLPKGSPKIGGLDVAGRSIYCDETGGDYFDFIELKDNLQEKLGVVVGDVVGHGISAALLMASVRSALHQRLASAGSNSQVIADINRQMAADLADSGRFVTLFYMTVDPERRAVKWVRAGHDPAIVYDPTTGEFIELAGSGMALGIDRQCQYEENRKGDLPRGSVIVIGTDGIWEARNESDQMFGRAALYDIISNNSEATASEIMATIFDQIDSFRNAAEPEDDVTLVVIKLL